MEASRRSVFQWEQEEPSLSKTVYIMQIKEIEMYNGVSSDVCFVRALEDDSIAATAIPNLEGPSASYQISKGLARQHQRRVTDKS